MVSRHSCLLDSHANHDRMILYYALSASLILFENIISNPQDQHAASDIHLMNLMTEFINQSVRPGTSFTATPTLSMFQELYSIATRLVSKVTPRTSQKMKRVSEIDDSSRSEQLVPDMSLFSDSKTHTTPQFVSSLSGRHSSQCFFFKFSIVSRTNHSQKNVKVTYPDTQELHQEDRDEKLTTELSHESTEDSPLEFAPFIPREQSEVDFYPAIYDSLLSSAGFDWDTANMPWSPSFELDTWLSTDLSLPQPDADCDDAPFL